MILEDREKRFYKQKELVEKYKRPLVLFRVNYPGDKNNYIVRTIFKLINLDLEYLEKHIFESSEGFILIGIVDTDSKVLKKKMIEIEENHPLGRLLDIDVYDEYFNQLSRTEFGFNDRKCLVCDELAKYCIRSRKHNLEEVQSKIYSMFVDYFSTYISELVKESMLTELNLLNKPGLITPKSNGAHSDMDYDLMVKSINSLVDGFRKLTTASFNDDFKTCKLIGVEMEKIMFLTTKNINTHKGGIFLFGSLIVGFIHSLRNNVDLQESIKAVMSGISNELQNDSYKSHGKEVYDRYGLLGIRGEAEKGYPLIFKNLDGSLLEVLFKIMSECDDTTILYRHDINTLKKVKEDSIDILNNFDINLIKALDKEYISKNISPGGSADLLGGVIFVNRIKEIL